MIHRTSRRLVQLAAARTLETLEPRRLLSFTGVDDQDHHQLTETFQPKVTYAVDHVDGFLTGASRGRPLDVALNFVRANADQFGLGAADLATPFVTDQYTSDTGVTHVYLMQEFNGLGVTNARMNVNVMADGRILSVGSSFVGGLGTLEQNAAAPVPALDPRQALRAVAGQIGVDDTRGISIASRTNRLDRRQTLVAPDFSVSAIPAHLQYVAQPNGGVALGWKMIVDLPDGEHWYELTVDAKSGAIIQSEDYVDHASYNVIPGPVAHPHDPSSGTSPNRQVVTDPHDTVASPFGWHDTNGAAGAEFTTTRGNNVSAYEDRDETDSPGPNSFADGGAALNFDFPLDLTLDPVGYTQAATSNLFYWNNLIHDVTYRYGFNEVSGNFQTNNYGNGGAGNDEVQAESQDEGDRAVTSINRNNANFGTPADGLKPRMQMYIWTQTTPQRDGDLDNRIIVHEYTHGISNRLTGGPANVNALNSLQSGGMGEGWGDFLSLLFTQKPTDPAALGIGVGTYAKGQPNDGQGVRRFPYSYDTTVGPISWDAFGSGTATLLNGATLTRSTAVHATGEIWCQTLWDVTWNLINKHGFSPNLTTGYDPANGHDEGNLLAFRLVMDGMKLQPANPSVIQARDAILAADVALTGGANRREIWAGFARRGLGAYASTAGATSSTIVTDYHVWVPDPNVIAHTPTGTSLTPASSIEFTFDHDMNPASFAVADDVQSFTGPGDVNLLGSITGSTWVTARRLRVDFATTTARGVYAMKIGPQITAADDGHAMDGDRDETPGEADDAYAANFTVQTHIGPEGFGYNAAQYPFESLDLQIGQPGVVTLINHATSTNLSSPINLPAGTTFNFYGTNHSTLFASDNGLITFGTANTSSTNATLTTTPAQAAIAVLWDAWDTISTAPGATDSAVLYRLDDVDGNGTPDRLVVEWSDVPAATESQGSVTFQAILQLNSGAAPGRIVANYVDTQTTSATTTNGASAAEGIKNAGTQGLQRLLVSNAAAHPWVGNGKAILYATDVEAPTVTASAFKFLTSHAATVTFSEDVGASVSAADLVLHNDTTNTTVDVAAQLASYDAGTNTATFTFPGLAGALLPDGDYTATITATGVTDASGNPIDGDDNGVIGGDFTFDFYFLNGDANRDRTVNLNDFNIVAGNFGQSPRDFGQGDFTYDGIVNLNDFNLLASRFGQTLGPASTASTAGAFAPGATTRSAGSPFGTGKIGGDEDDQSALDELS